MIQVIPLKSFHKKFKEIGGNEFKHDSNSRGQLRQDEPPLVLPNEPVESFKDFKHFETPQNPRRGYLTARLYYIEFLPKDVIPLKGKEFVVESKKPFPLQAGGEFLGYTKVIKLKVEEEFAYEDNNPSLLNSS